MLKVLIADDEVKVIQLIEYLVDWQAFGMEIIDRVHDGETALLAIREKQPDIVVTDIRMPGLGGIELVQKTQEAGLDPFFIMISGYSEFEYAQKAIQLGVEDYLLKPLRKKDLEAVLSKILEKSHVRRETSAALGELSKTRKLARTRLLTDVVVNRDLTVFELTDEEFAARYGVSLSGSSMECLITRVFPGMMRRGTESTDEYRFIMPKLQEIVESRLSPLCREIISTVLHNDVITLISHGGQQRERIAEEIAKLKINVLGYRNIYPEMRIAVGFSRTVENIRGIPDAYRDAACALIRRFAGEDRFILDGTGEAAAGEAHKDSLLQPQARKALLGRIELLDAEGFRALAADQFFRMRDHLDRPAALRDSYSALCETFLFGLRSLDSLPEDTAPEAEQLEDAFNLLYSFRELEAFFTDTCAEILRKCSNEKKALEDKPIRQAKQYIQEHYNEAITLEAVSSEVGFNPAYFSTIFKKSTGQNFMDYIKEVRINNAKDMLARTGMDVASVAQAVGYSDIKYFTRLFRKATSLTPTDYRRLYG